MRMVYHMNKGNVVVDAIRLLSMKRVAYAEDEKKELEKYV